MIKMKSYGWGAHHEALVCSGSAGELENAGIVVFSILFTCGFLRVKNRRWKMDVAPCEVFERGCNARGRLQVPRVPGHLELMAGGGDQTLNPRRQRFRAVELLADTF